MTSEKENPWSEDETDTGTTTEANEPIEVDDDVSKTRNKESFSPVGPVYTTIFSNLSNSEQF
jgi:hypothetical protein